VPSTGWKRCGAPTWTRSRPPLSELRLIAVGRIGRGPEADLFRRYADRIRPRLAVTEIAEARGSAGEIKRREADAILAALPDNATPVALDLGGIAPTSEALSNLLDRWLEAGRPVCFVIGGAEGLDARVIARAAATLSLGPLTWPHLLARVMLAEQLFRARAISAGHPYHRAGRP
jgi:23S rRNA (pseudouridine1915-N3)-methyltransferase